MSSSPGTLGGAEGACATSDESSISRPRGPEIPAMYVDLGILKSLLFTINISMSAGRDNVLCLVYSCQTLLLTADRLTGARACRGSLHWQCASGPKASGRIDTQRSTGQRGHHKRLSSLNASYYQTTKLANSAKD